jgi:hypothetical protein
MTMLRIALKAGSISGLALVGFAQAVFAGGMTGVPGPIVGAGLPLVLLAGGAYIAVKLIRARRRD